MKKFCQCPLIFKKSCHCHVRIRSDILEGTELFHPQTKFGARQRFHSRVSFCSQGGGFCMMSLPVWLPGPMFLLGWSLSLVPCSFQGVSVQGSLFRGCLSGVSVLGVSVQGSPWGSLSKGSLSGGLCQVKSRWYASYWNAFLYKSYYWIQFNCTVQMWSMENRWQVQYTNYNIIVIEL